jgi:hypothetical protein
VRFAAWGAVGVVAVGCLSAVAGWASGDDAPPSTVAPAVSSAHGDGALGSPAAEPPPPGDAGLEAGGAVPDAVLGPDPGSGSDGLGVAPPTDAPAAPSLAPTDDLQPRQDPE